MRWVEIEGKVAGEQSEYYPVQIIVDSIVGIGKSNHGYGTSVFVNAGYGIGVFVTPEGVESIKRKIRAACEGEA